MAGNHNRIINIRPHLDGVHDQVAQKIQRRLLQIREGKIDPYTSLNHENEQHRKPRRIEGKQKNDNDKQGGEHAD